MPIEDFVERRDEPVLRAWLARIAEPGGESLAGLRRTFNLRHPNLLARETLRSFLNPEHRINDSTRARLGVFWNFLRANVLYAARFPYELQAAVEQKIPPRDAADRLELSLLEFFKDGPFRNLYSLLHLQDHLTGNYVMYYPEQHVKKTRPDVIPLIRATWLNIAKTPFGLALSERQTWEDKPPHQWALNQRNEGVAFPYWKLVVGIMNCRGYASFKCVLFTKLDRTNKTDDIEAKYDSLRGEILTADEQGPHQSVRLMCRRFDGEAPPHWGTYAHEELDSEVVNHVKSSDPLIISRMLDDRGKNRI